MHLGKLLRTTKQRVPSPNMQCDLVQIRPHLSDKLVVPALDPKHKPAESEEAISFS